MIELPQDYLENMKKLLKQDYESYLNSFNEERKYGLRVNTSKISVEDFLKIMPYDLKPIPWTSDGFYFDPNDNLTKHPYYYAGLYYIQEPSAMLPAEVLPIEKNDIVLDGCSAPGGKAIKLCDKLQNTGLLIANDISSSRAQILLKTIENHGVRNVYVMAEDLSKLDRFNNTFDKILIDAPCSGEGMFRKEPELIKSWLKRGNEYYADIQRKIITKALDMLKDGGMLVYSTCTFSPIEDEQIIEYALDLCPTLKVLPIKQYEGFETGISEKTKNCVRLYPHKINGEGHFVALLQKQGTINKQIKDSIPSHLNIEGFNLDKTNYSLIERKDKLYLEPNSNLNFDGLRILRSGLYLGEYKHDNFEPSEHLALSISTNDYDKIINLDINDERVNKYLKCETINVSEFNIEGYCLICVNNYPLGFGLIKNGIFKNKYPANYRMK